MKILIIFIKKIFYQTILHCACSSGNADLVRFLISLNEISITEIDISIIVVIYDIITIEYL